MARRKPKAVVILEQKGVEIVDLDPLGLEVTIGDEVSVRHVPLESARELYTVPVDSPIWGGSPPTRLSRFEGAIVRLRPPEQATDDAIEEIRGFFLKHGAVKVVVMPRPRAELLPSKAPRAQAKAVGAREAVVGLVEESNSKDKGALRKLCEHVMGEVGL